MCRHDAFEIYRRWFNFPKQEGRAEMFFHIVKDHLEGSCDALYLLHQ